MRKDRKSLGFNISRVASQRMPTNAALILRKVESILLRHCHRVSGRFGLAGIGVAGALVMVMVQLEVGPLPERLGAAP
jgi:hypothetical protein